MSLDKTVIGRNLYEILDIEDSVSQNEIIHAYNRSKTAYNKEAIASYSLVDDQDRKSILEEIEMAFKILGDPTLRKKYDCDKSIDLSKITQFKHQYASVQDTLRTHEVKQSTVAKADFKVIDSEEINTEEEEREIFELTGDFFRQWREKRSFSVEDISRLSKVSVRSLKKIEQEDFEDYHPTYLKGHLKLLCQSMNLKGDVPSLIKNFMSTHLN